MEIPGPRGKARAETLCSLAASARPKPDGGSRMTGDCHVRFCESPGLQRPGPLTGPAKKASKKKKKKAKGAKKK